MNTYFHFFCYFLWARNCVLLLLPATLWRQRKQTDKTKLKELIYIFIGSGLGGLTRFGLGKWINNFLSTNFPFGTFIVNILACLVLGFVVGLADNRQIISPQTKLFWVVGFCGGFSTFSTFSNETLNLLQSGYHMTNIIYILTSVILCLTFTYFGLLIANKI